MTNFESEPRPISDISRYYADILYAENQSINIYQSLERLLDALPFSSDLMVDALYDEKLMKHQLDAEPRAAKERMALMPFLHISPLLEASDVPTADVKQWYDDAVTGVSWLTDEEHDNACSKNDSGTSQYPACAISAVCPQRFLQYHLSKDIYLPNFQSDMYANRPSRAIALASDKLEIGVKYKILPEDDSETAWKSYCADYDEYVYAMLSFPTQDIDKNTPQ
jgi:hypothetical protein